MSRTIAIGDIHGCADALRTLLSAITPTSDDTIVTLGDYVDRGPNSRGVLDQLLELRSQCRVVSLMGNHELMMLAVLRDELEPHLWQRYGGRETLASYGGQLEKVDQRHREFLASCRYYYENDTHLFVHANYVAELELCEQPEQILFWTHISTVLPPPHRSGKTAIVGHTPQINGTVADFGHLVCIDTCCFAGGWLTALDVTSGRIWQADRSGNLREETAVSEREP